MSNTHVIALDSCSILHLLCESTKWLSHLEPVITDGATGHAKIIVSEVSLAECRYLKSSDGKPRTPEESAAIITRFFYNPFIVRRGITSRESTLAGKLIDRHGLGTCDALIAATAVFAGATLLYTTDGCSNRRKAGKLVTVGEVVTDCGKRMKIEAPDASRYIAMKAASRLIGKPIGLT